MTDDELEPETLKLLSYFEERGFTPADSCAVMGFALICLIGDYETAKSFMQTLERSFSLANPTRNMNTSKRSKRR